MVETAKPNGADTPTTDLSASQIQAIINDSQIAVGELMQPGK